MYCRPLSIPPSVAVDAAQNRPSRRYPVPPMVLNGVADAGYIHMAETECAGVE